MANADEADIPPGWNYNPAAWSQRLPIVGLAVIGFFIALYLAAYQYCQQFGWCVVTDPWEPFFGRGTEKILNSRLSWVAWPFSDALLGALGYLADAVAGSIGGPSRWRNLPWTVILFAILVGPLGAISIALVVAQPVVEGEWCTLCLCTALISVLMIGPAMDEALASLQYMKRLVDSGRVSWFQAFWGGHTPPVPPRHIPH